VKNEETVSPSRNDVDARNEASRNDENATGEKRMVSIRIDADRVRPPPPARFSRNLSRERARGLGFSRARSLPAHGLCFSRARSPASCPSTSTLISSGPSTKFQDPTFSGPNPSQIDMNPLRPPSSSSKQGKAGRGRGAPAAVAARSTSVDGARIAPTDGSSSAAGNPAVVAAAASPPLPSLQAT